MYIYPDNLKGHATMLLWRMWDMVFIVIGCIVSLIIYLNISSSLPLIITGLGAFLTMRIDDMSLFEYLKYAIRFCITKRQLFYWEVDK